MTYFCKIYMLLVSRSVLLSGLNLEFNLGLNIGLSGLNVGNNFSQSASVSYSVPEGSILG